MSFNSTENRLIFVGTLGRFWDFLPKLRHFETLFGWDSCRFFILGFYNSLKRSLETFLIFSFCPKICGLCVVFDLWDVIKKCPKTCFLIIFFRNVVFENSFSKVCRSSLLENATVSDWLTSEHFLTDFSKIAKMRFLYLVDFSLGFGHFGILRRLK